MNFTDTVAFKDAHKTADGFLIADVRVARTGIQNYRGIEVGRPDLGTVAVFRSEDEVFSTDALKTFARRPVTLGHPSDLVTPGNVSDVMVGITDSEIARDGDFVRVPMMLMDQGAIDAVEGGINQLSMGYTADIEFVDGVTPNGDAFQAVQRNLRMNHLAIVAAARGGSQLKIGDTHDGGGTMTDKTRSITVDGIPCEVADVSAAVIEKALKDAETRLTDAHKATADAEATIAERDKALAAKDADIEDLKSKIVDDAAIDARVEARAALIDIARKIDPDVVTDGKSEGDIKRAVVVAKFGDDMKAKADAYIDARFDIAADGAKDATPGNDPVRDALRQTTAAGDEAAKAHDEMTAQMRDAWRGETPKGVN